MCVHMICRAQGGVCIVERLGLLWAHMCMIYNAQGGVLSICIICNTPPLACHMHIGCTGRCAVYRLEFLGGLLCLPLQQMNVYIL